MIPRLHLVTDDRVLAMPRFQAQAEAALEAGGDRVALHLRGPGSGGRVLWDRARSLLPVASRTGCLLLVNDRVDVALFLGMDGVHLPGHGFPVAEARALLPRETLLGRSLHEAVELAESERPDFALVGTLFMTPSHPGRPGAGPGRVTRTRRLNPGLPLLGVGGISLDRVGSVMAAGAHGVALLRAVWDHPQPHRSVANYLESVEDALTSLEDARGTREGEGAG
jgi:thiamine-phosphate pyrophosphorylase